MLKQRVITAVILVALVLVSLFASNPIYWRILITGAIFVALWEWLRFCKITSIPAQIASYLGFASCFFVLQSGYLSISVVIPAVCLLWLALLTFTVSNAFSWFHQPIIKLLVGIVILSTAAWMVIEFKSIEDGPLWVLCFMVSVWAADVGAYFIGRRFGKTKLAPTVSPGKTVEGLLGGLVLVLLLYIPLLLFYFPLGAAILLLVTVVITALVSVGGDLFESKLKRYVDLKDSSQILPGHGGVLDRIDSLLSAAPFFSLGLLVLGYLN